MAYHFISSAQFDVYAADFAAFDKDGSGALEKAEVAQLLEKQLGSKPDDAAVQTFLGELDTNEDGKVSLPEYLKHIFGSDAWAVDDKPSDGCTAAEQEGFKRFDFPFAAVSSLDHVETDFANGRALLNLKDQAVAYRPVFVGLLRRFGRGRGFLKPSQFQLCCESLQLVDDFIDEDVVRAQYFETCGYPDDEDNQDEVEALQMSTGQLAAALMRVANQRSLMLHGSVELGFAAQLVECLEQRLPLLAPPLLSLQTLQALSSSGRPDSFFLPPAEFSSGKRFAFLDVTIGSQPTGRIEVELDFDSAPITAYNFAMLCTGERGQGALTGKVPAALMAQNASWRIRCTLGKEQSSVS